MAISGISGSVRPMRPRNPNKATEIGTGVGAAVGAAAAVYPSMIVMALSADDPAATTAKSTGAGLVLEGVGIALGAAVGAGIGWVVGNLRVTKAKN